MTPARPPAATAAPEGASAKSQQQAALAQAFAAHREGKLAEAQTLYRTMLAGDPSNADTWHLLGGVLLQSEDFAGAEENFLKALALREDPLFLLNLGRALQAQKKWEAAVTALCRAIELVPANVEVRHQLGLVYLHAGRLDEAESTLRAALSIAPHEAPTLYALASVLEKLHRLDESEATAREAVEIKPDFGQAWFQLGLVLNRLGRLRDSEDAHRKAIELGQTSAEAYHGLAVAVQRRRKWNEAQVLFERAVELKPDFAAAINGVGTTHRHRGQLAQAEAAFRRALEIDPAHFWALNNLGVLLSSMRRRDEAEEVLRRALALRPDNADVMLNLGMLLLATGRFKEGWPLYEARLLPGRFDGSLRSPTYSFPVWQGEPLEGKSLAVWSEQGFGDTIQAARYAPLLRQLGVSKLTWVCREPLRELLSTAAGIDEIIDQDAACPPHDFWIHAMSLPLRCGTALDTIPAKLPYLHASPPRLDRWRARLPQRGFKVGLVWKGSPNHLNDASRSLPGLETLAPLWSVPGVTFVSLQQAAGKARGLKAGGGQPLLPLADDIEDFADSAAIIEQLDLLISVDTAPIHLAGALAKPVWVLLPARGVDFRWLADRDDSPWYPRVMRLFHQTQADDWPPLIAQVRDELSKLVPRGKPAGIHQLAMPSIVLTAPRRAPPVKTEADILELHRHGGELMARGDFEGAERCFRQVLASREDPVVMLNLGRTLQARRKLEEAEAFLRKALALLPESVDIQRQIGLVLLDAGRLSEAQASLAQALSLDPGNALTLSAMGRAHERLDQLPEAQANLRAAIAAQPDLNEAWFALGHVLRRSGRLQEAEAAHRFVAERDPGSAEALAGLATVQQLQPDRWDEAQATWARVLAIDGRHARALRNLGTLLAIQGDTTQAEPLLRQALEVDPANADARAYLGMLLLTTGRFKEGWPLYEARYESRHLEAPTHSFPQWTGEPLTGKSLLVWSEQGFGDTIQIARYAPLLRHLGLSKLTWVCREPLRELMESVEGIDRVVAPETPVDAHDYWCRAMSLPLRLGTQLDTIPSQLPYLHASPERVAKWRAQLPAGGFKVGLIWKGSGNLENDARSLPDLKSLAPWWSVPGVTFISLQKGTGEEEAAMPPEGQPIVAAGGGIGSFADTAALIDQVDLVITVDTAAAHLAGAMGKPVWVMLPAHGVDWRWMRDRSDSPWYPGAMRLFRRGLKDAWPVVVEEVRGELARLASSRTAATDRQSLHERGGELMAAGDLAGAQVCFREALAFGDDGVVLLNLGRTLQAQGKLGEAETTLRQALALLPGSPEVLRQIGQVLHDAGRADDARAELERALELAPGDPLTLSALGRAHETLGHLDEAEVQLRAATAAQPTLTEAWFSLGHVLRRRGQLDEAEAAHRVAVQLAPRSAEAINGLAALLQQQPRHWDEAQALLNKALAANPGHAKALTNLGTLLAAKGDLARAEALLRQAARLHPGNADVTTRLAMLLLASGQFEEGWRVYEGRHAPGAQGAMPAPDFPFPLWRGEDLKGKSLLVWSEQGFGDVLLVVRYAALLRERGVSRLVWACRPPLHRLLETVAGIDDVCDADAALPVCDYWCFSMSLPLRFGANAANTAARLPYLHAPFDRVEKWRSRIPATGLRVGIAWRGAAQQANDFNRSLTSLKALAPLWRVPGITFVSLQKGAGESEALAPPAGQPLVALGHELGDYADTAAIVSLLDLVISVDTSVVHLAGALGTPVWAMLPVYGNYFLWLLDRDDSPWYPGVMRLFRQQRAGDWAAVIERVADALAQRVAAPSRPRSPADDTDEKFRFALALEPQSARTWHDWGLFLQHERRWAESERALRRAITLEPDMAVAQANLGALLRVLDRPIEAEPVLRQALALQPDLAVARYNLGCVMLALGRFEEGLPEYEARISADMNAAVAEVLQLPWPQWTGEPLKGKSILIWPEQGYGDNLQFARYAILLKERGARHVGLCSRDELASVLETVDGVDAVYTGNTVLPPFDYWVLALSLPLRLGTTLANLPARLPYVHANPALVEQWRPRIPSAGLKVGLVWKGAAAHGNNLERSMPSLATLAPLWTVDGCSFVSLQKGDGEDEALHPPATQPIAALGSELRDFGDTAAIVAQLDLVICVDTAVAHLAAAMGKPTWIALPGLHNDWRWMTIRADSPWYPAVVRLFRRTTGQAWATVVEALRCELERTVAIMRDATQHNAVNTAANEWFTKGNLARREGRLEDAASHYRQAISLAPRHARFHGNLGVVLRAMGQVDEAEAAYLQAIEVDPGYAQAHANLGNLLRGAGRADEAEAAYRHAIAVDPNFADAHAGFGLLLQSRGQVDQALASLRAAVATRPDFAQGWSHLAMLLNAGGKTAEASDAFRRALELDPQLADSWNQYGVLLQAQRHWVEAEAAYRHALEVAPAHAAAWSNLGTLMWTLGRLVEAQEFLLKAVTLAPQLAPARCNLGCTLLTLGRYAQGWPYYESRLSPDIVPAVVNVPRLPWPQWQGEPIEGRSVLIWSEQGAGDNLQFTRYAAEFKKRGAARVSIGCRSMLKPVLETLAGVDALYIDNETIPPHDYWVLALSLPLRMGTTLETIPTALPYLHTKAERVERWRAKIPQERLKVGLAWKGFAGHSNDVERSLPSLDTLAPLWGIAGCTFVSLQKGEGEEEALQASPARPLVALGQDLQDYGDTAAVISQLDLVICVDTSVAHLAAALGKPTWILLPRVGCDWRWMTGRDDSPWYPGVVRLFRRPMHTEWAAVIDEVRAELEKLQASLRPAKQEPKAADESAANEAFSAGNLARRQGRAEEAERHYRRAIALAPRAARYRSNLGVLLRAAGRIDEAEATYREAIEVDPGYGEAHANLGNLLRAAGRLDEAEASYRAAVAAKPKLLSALNGLGALLMERKRWEEAEAMFRRAVDIDPSHAESWNNLGTMLQDARRMKESEEAYARALALKPDFADASNNLGILLQKAGRNEEAHEIYQRALRLKPDDPRFANNEAALLVHGKKWDEAEQAYRRALELLPDYPDARNNLGALLNITGRPQEGQEQLREALRLRPDFAEARLNIGMQLLTDGQFEEGWRMYESRHAPELKDPTVMAPNLAFPQWRGEPLEGKSLVIWPEQGFGDCIQFIRYTPLLKARGVTRITMVCQPPLVSVLQTMEGVDEVVADLSQLRPHDFWAFALSLPMYFRTTLDSIPASLPYLAADPARVEHWKQRLLESTSMSGAQLKIGLVWKGAAGHKNDMNRSLPSLATLAPLWSIRGAVFVSLQKGQGEEEALNPPEGQPITALGQDINDFGDTAAIIANLDIVVGVDTAIAHLAGAMGKPVGVLLPAVGVDWRWLRQRTDSPWYPQVMRLFRQPSPGDWATPVQEVVALLEATAPAATRPAPAKPRPKTPRAPKATDSPAKPPRPKRGA